MQNFKYGFQDENKTITLELEDGAKLLCNVIAIFSANEEDYVAVVPKDKEIEEVYLYRFVGEGDTIDIGDIEVIEDDEFLAVKEAFEPFFMDFEIFEELKEKEGDVSYWTDCDLIMFESRVIRYIDQCSTIKEPDLERIFLNAHKFNKNDRVSEYALGKLLQLYGTGKFVCSNGDTATLVGYPDLNKFREIVHSADIYDVVWSLCQEFLEVAERIDEHLTVDEIELFEAALLSIEGEWKTADGLLDINGESRVILFWLYFQGDFSHGLGWGVRIPELMNKDKAIKLLEDNELMEWLLYDIEMFVNYECPEKQIEFFEMAYKLYPNNIQIVELLLANLFEHNIKRLVEVLSNISHETLNEYLELHEDAFSSRVLHALSNEQNAEDIEKYILTIIDCLSNTEFEDVCFEFKDAILDFYESGDTESYGYGGCEISCPQLENHEKAVTFAKKYDMLYHLCDETLEEFGLLDSDD